jgi:hypothetical protein
VDRYQPFIDAIWKSRRKSPPHPFTEQALRDLEETAEWKELGRRQFKDRRQFDARERSMLGVIANIVRLHYARLGSPGIGGLFKLMVSGAERYRQLDKLQQNQKQDLRQRQANSRKIRADTLRAARRHEVAQLSQQFERDRAAMKMRHAAEVSRQRTDWRELASERQKVWSEYRQAFQRSEPEREDITQGSPTRDQFHEAATATRSPEVKPAQPAADITESAADRSATKGWRARRTAAERKADGTYRPRNRDNDSGDRSRQRERREPD